MIRFPDGFDTRDPAQVRTKYNGYTASLDQDILIDGRDGFGKAFTILNNAFGEANYLSTFTDQQPLWGFHADVMIAKVGTGATFPTSVDWYRFNGAGATQLTLRFVAFLGDGPFAGRLQLVVAGIVIATSGSSIFMDQWNTIEVQATFNGGSCSATVRKNGVTWVTGGYSSLAPVDALGFRWAAFGPPSFAIDNYLVYDGQAGGVNDFTGRIRIETLLPIRDVVSAWGAVPGPTRYAMVNDFIGRAGGSPDGDLTYITPSGSIGTQWFEFAPATCFGKIWGVALNLSVRAAGVPAAVACRTQPLATPYTIGSSIPATAYQIFAQVAETNPETSSVWNDAQVNAAYFGFESPGSPARITAAYLEKIASLEPLPYDCGGAPYSF